MSSSLLPIPHVHLRLEATPAAAGAARRRLAEFVSDNGGSDELAVRTSLAVTEAVSNVVQHAYLDVGWIECEADIDDDLLEVVVADRGHGLGPSPSDGLGAGLVIIAACADDFTIRSGDGEGIEVWMRFALR